MAESKDIIKKYTGGKAFLKNKNLTDAQITTKAAEYIAQEKFADAGGGSSFPRGRQNKRKIWSNIYESSRQDGRFEMLNPEKFKNKNGKFDFRTNSAWRNVSFKDKKSGKIFTYDNLKEKVDKYGGG